MSEAVRRGFGTAGRMVSKYERAAAVVPTSRPFCSDRYQRCSSDLVENFRGRQPVTEAGRDRRDHGLVDLFHPALRRDCLRYRLARLLLQVAAEPGDVVEQPAGLVLFRTDAGLLKQLPNVQARLRDLGPYPQPGPLGRADQLQLVGVKAQLVKPPEAFGDPVPLLLRPQRLLLGQLVPQTLVPALELLPGQDGVNPGRQQSARFEVEQLAADPLDRELDVKCPLPGTQDRVLLAGLGIHEVGLKSPRVVAEQRVRQRAVPPEEPGHVQPDKEFDHGVEQPTGRLAAVRAGEQGTVSRRVLQEPGHQDRVGVRAAVDHDANHLHGRDAHRGQRAKQPVLAPGKPLADGLQGVQFPALGNEPDHVTGKPALPDLDQPLVPPLLKRQAERQAQQPRRVIARRAENESHHRVLPWPQCAGHLP